MNIIEQNMRTVSLNRRGEVDKAQLRYIVDGAENAGSDSKILLHILEQAPENIGNSVRSGAEIISCRQPDILEVAVNYLTPAEHQDKERRAERRDGDRLWSSRCFLKESKCFSTPDKQQIFPADGDSSSAAEYAIAWNGRYDSSSRFDGINRLTPVCEEECRRFLLASRCSLAYRKEVMSLTGKLNSRPFRMWEPGEVMLADVTISEPFENELNQTLVELGCTFSIRRNSSSSSWCGINIGKTGGWDHIWGIYHADPRNRIVRGSCAYVGRLYDSADFGILGVEA